MATDLKSKTARAALAPRREPHWQRVREGGYIGYRRAEQGEGTWIARWRAADGRQHYRALGTILDTSAARAFDVASQQARDWFDGIAAGVAPKVVTVSVACQRYVAAIRDGRGGRVADEVKALRAEADFRRLIDSDPIARIELPALTRDQVQAWRSRLQTAPAKIGRGTVTKGRPKMAGTVNRDIVPFRAALNLALDDQLVANDHAWRVDLRPIKGADRRREGYLSREQRRSLIEHADDDFKPLLQAMSLLPLRPGAMAALTAADFDARLGTLRVGKDKQGADRRIKLPPATAAFVKKQAASKLPAASLFTMADGRAWTKDLWKKPMRRAVKAAALPAATTLYVMRHSTITDLVAAGLPLLTIAQISGTSVAMVEAHYGHLRSEASEAALAGLTL